MLDAGLKDHVEHFKCLFTCFSLVILTFASRTHGSFQLFEFGNKLLSVGAVSQ